MVVRVDWRVSLGLVGTDGELYAREAFLSVSLIWFLVAVGGAVPFVVAGDGVTAHPVNALVESMSGVTTTGETVMLDFDAHARSIMMWRQLVQWLGGLGILILATAILSEVGVSTLSMMRSLSEGSVPPRITRSWSSANARITEAASPDVGSSHAIRPRSMPSPSSRSAGPGACTLPGSRPRPPGPSGTA